jgi:triosephosphate isomerase
MNFPIIIVNFKTYAGAVAAQALDMAKLHAKVAKKTGVNFAVAPQLLDLRMIASEVNIPVLAQHFDPVEQGPFTGHVSPYALKEIGVRGAILNHAERSISLELIEKSLEMARNLGLYSVVCANDPYLAKAIFELDPDLVAVEPPELIGGDVPVTDKPHVIDDAVAMIGKGKVIVGAGIKTGKDVQIALQHGAVGVLVSSGVVKSPDPEKALFELASGL